MLIVHASIQIRASVLGIKINSTTLEMDVEIIVISPCEGKDRRPHVVDMALSPCPLGSDFCHRMYICRLISYKLCHNLYYVTDCSYLQLVDCNHIEFWLVEYIEY